MRRAIVALGEQDVDVSMLEPLSDATILGACSDDLVLHVRDTKVRVGSEIRFAVEYGALLRAMTSPYVQKDYLGLVEDAPRVHRRGLCQRAPESARAAVRDRPGPLPACTT